MTEVVSLPVTPLVVVEVDVEAADDGVAVFLEVDRAGLRLRATRVVAGRHQRAAVRQLVGHERALDDLDGSQGDGQTLMWARLPGVIEGVDAASLAVLGDFVPMGVGQALGVRGGGNSLDNTLRVVNLVPTEWVLLDIRVHAVERGFGHGLVHMFAEDGTLLATASQSCIVRFWKG